MEEFNISFVIISCLILTLGVVGNVALSVVILRQLSQQAVKNYSYLILNLAISDILVVLSSIPFDIVQRYTRPVYPFGPVMCKLLWPFQTVCSMASIFTVGALSFQRYRFIIKPRKGKLSRKTFLVMLLTIWLLPVLLAGVPYSFVLRYHHNTSRCVEQWPEHKQAELKLGFTSYLFIIQYVLPLSLILWCNVKAIWKLKRYLKYRRRGSILCAVPFENHENAVKMLIVIVAVFALFWLPGQIMTLVLEVQKDNEFITTYGLDIGFLFVFANCIANPFIFAYFTNYRKKICVLVKRPMRLSQYKPVEATAHAHTYLSTPAANERNSEVDNGSWLMKNFLDVLRTMTEDKLRKFLDNTPETET